MADAHRDDPGGHHGQAAHAGSFATAEEHRLARAAADAAPQAAELLAQHLEQHQELLPILYLDGLGVWFLAAWRSRATNPDRFAQAVDVAAVLDSAFTADPSLRNAIAVGFLEMFTFLPESEQTSAASTLPPALRAEYTAMAAWRT
jgi:hypothetical protein